jgi:hypothetical protein
MNMRLPALGLVALAAHVSALAEQAGDFMCTRGACTVQIVEDQGATGACKLKVPLNIVVVRSANPNGAEITWEVPPSYQFQRGHGGESRGVDIIGGPQNHLRHKGPDGNAKTYTWDMDAVPAGQPAIQNTYELHIRHRGQDCGPIDPVIFNRD